ncbi:hypothetical protein LRY65_03250 [Candidatus Woesebacteria bacterium]|nr:hypothetical protein [Candidatus Woesebacteria bacterium]MCD8527203.1 hypothetical protein [Candidatus Woesebacteria bacterium]MCD8546567.1 hypothetical protein [Candidatus Woesebacteria bacterium]
MTTAHITTQLRRTLLTLIFSGLIGCGFSFQASQVQAQETSEVSETDPLTAPTPVSQQASPTVVNIDEITRGEVGLTAIPPRLGDDGSLEVQPGQLIQVEVRVRNTSNQVQTIQTVAEDFIIGENGRTPIPIEGQRDSRWSLASWLEIPNNTTVLPPGVSQSVPVLIRVPDTALPGGRYAMIMHQPITGGDFTLPNGETGGQAAVNQRVGTLVYVRVAGAVKEEAHIRNISIPSFSEFGPVPIAFEIENLSDIHIRPSSQIRITNMFGQEIDEIQVESQNVFPYTLREFRTEWDRVWGFGRYTAHFMTVYGSQGETITASFHFWVVPYKLLLTIVVLLLALLGIIISVRRHLQHRNDATTQHVALLEDRIRQLENELQEHE